MANRNDPDARQHETLPGLCPAPGQSPSLPSGARPVEQMVDAAIERRSLERHYIARSPLERSPLERSHLEPSHLEPSHNLDIQRVAHEQRLAPYASDGQQLTPASRRATRLRWKGLEVSEEFRMYAERVARGEDLPPFEGRVLAEPSAEFPWGPLSRSEPLVAPRERPGRGGQLALWASAAIVTGLLGWSVALKLGAIEPPRALLDLASPAAGEQGVDTRAALAPHALPPEPAVALDAPAKRSDRLAPGLTALPQPVEAAPAASTSAAASGAPGVAASEPPVPVSVAPSLAEPLPAAREPVAQPVSSSQPAPPVPPPVPPRAVPPRAPAASPRAEPEVDFGIDELPLPGPAGASLAPVSASPGSAARKEPGSESSAKGSLLVEKPSF